MIFILPFLLTVALAPLGPPAYVAQGLAWRSLGEVWVTAYTSLPHLTDSTPWTTASLTRTRVEYRDGKPWHVVAVSRDLLPYLPFGSRIRLQCQDKVYHGLVEDLMHRRWRRKVDLWFPRLDQAVRFGRQICVLETLRQEVWYGQDKSHLSGRKE